MAAPLYEATSALVARLQVDDVVDAFAVHAMGGVWGCVAVGLLHRDKGLFYGGNSARWTQLAAWRYQVRQLRSLGRSGYALGCA